MKSEKKAAEEQEAVGTEEEARPKCDRTTTHHIEIEMGATEGGTSGGGDERASRKASGDWREQKPKAQAEARGRRKE